MASVTSCLLSVLLLTSQLYGTEAMVTRDSKIHGETLASNDTPQVHIVYMGGLSETTTTNHASFHASMLQEALGSLAEDVSHHILYSYTNSFNGFAAVFSENHAETIRGMEGVVSVFKSQNKELHTTESWQFLGLTPTEGLWSQLNFGNGTIVGLVDTGIWPESKSFNDDGFGPIPSTWKGKCVEGENFTSSFCNNKLIGARFYSKGYESQNGPIVAPEMKSARDAIGHGTHTASTSIGRQVTNASFLGVGKGTATGGAPSARVAMYKACWFGSCSDADMLAAIDDAIADGIDVISISLGSLANDYLVDAIAIGTFHAVEKGIVVSCSAGNMGPTEGSVQNVAPWIFTVGASTISRVYQTDVELENDTTVPGIAINTFLMNSTYPIVYAEDILANGSSDGTGSCEFSLIPHKAEGKIIVCNGTTSPNTDLNIQMSGGVGYIAFSNSDQSVQFETVMPSTNVDSRTGNIIVEYLNSTKNPKAIIRPSITIFNTTAAPNMAAFSAVGPNMITSSIHKPDITAPGVDILAAWSPIANPSEQGGDTRHTDFNIISGTSMSCPHVSGLVALVKSAHPGWSPAAIKSAIMTTATPLNTSISGNSALASGAGQIDPTKAADPGLVFNLTSKDYINFLCSIGYNSTQVRIVSGRNETCPKKPPTVLDLNYPSIYVTLNSNSTTGSTFTSTRTATNVGPASSSYSVSVEAPPGTVVQVEPSTLTFSNVNEEQSFTVIIKLLNRSQPDYNFGSITWIDDTNIHSVRILTGTGVSPLS